MLFSMLAFHILAVSELCMGLIPGRVPRPGLPSLPQDGLEVYSIETDGFSGDWGESDTCSWTWFNNEAFIIYDWRTVVTTVGMASDMENMTSSIYEGGEEPFYEVRASCEGENQWFGRRAVGMTIYKDTGHDIVTQIGIWCENGSHPILAPPPYDVQRPYYDNITELMCPEQYALIAHATRVDQNIGLTGVRIYCGFKWEISTIALNPVTGTPENHVLVPSDVLGVAAGLNAAGIPGYWNKPAVCNEGDFGSGLTASWCGHGDLYPWDKFSILRLRLYCTGYTSYEVKSSERVYPERSWIDVVNQTTDNGAYCISPSGRREPMIGLTTASQARTNKTDNVGLTAIKIYCLSGNYTILSKDNQVVNDDVVWGITYMCPEDHVITGIFNRHDLYSSDMTGVNHIALYCTKQPSCSQAKNLTD